jgi:hypothetical protein
VVDGLDPNTPLIVVVPVDDPVTARPCHVPGGQLKVKRSADAMWIDGKGAVHELRYGRDDLLGKPCQIALRCR